MRPPFPASYNAADISVHADLAQKLAEMEKKYDTQFKMVFEAIRQLMTPPTSPKRKIGFNLKEKKAIYSIKGIRQGKKKPK